MYQKIVNPKTNRKVKVNSKIGKSIIKSYYNALVTGGSDKTDFVWENPFKDPDATRTSVIHKVAERAAKRADTPKKFSLKIKFAALKPVTLKDVNASDTIYDVMAAYILHEGKPELANRMDRFTYFYYPYGPDMGSIPIEDGKKYSMEMLRAGPDSMIQIGLKLTGGSAKKDFVWNNPHNDPEVATKDWNQTKPKWFETEERMKKRNKPPDTPFNIQLKWLDKKPVTVKLIEASDSVEEVVLKWIAAAILPDNPEAADKIADKLHTFAYYYHPDGPGNGPPIPLVDGKKYDMHRLRAGPDSMIHVMLKPRGGNRRKLPRQ